MRTIGYVRVVVVVADGWTQFAAFRAFAAPWVAGAGLEALAAVSCTTPTFHRACLARRYRVFDRCGIHKSGHLLSPTRSAATQALSQAPASHGPDAIVNVHVGVIPVEALAGTATATRAPRQTLAGAALGTLGAELKTLLRVAATVSGWVLGRVSATSWC